MVGGNKSASWMVHATVAEPPQLLAAYVAHYLAMGASEVHLCLDRPDDETIALFEGVDRVRLTLCDETYWQRIAGERPPLIVRRQTMNANAAYKDCKADWFLFCDADEFVSVAPPLGEILADHRPEDGFLRLMPAERVLVTDTPQESIFSGRFRRAVQPSRKLAPIYGELNSFLKHGLSGHVVGKAITPRGGRYHIWQHYPIAPGQTVHSVRNGNPGAFADRILADAWLAHFDGLTLLHSQIKALLKAVRAADQFDKLRDGANAAEASRPMTHRRRQTAEYYHAGNSRAAIKKMRGILELSPLQLAQLEEIGGLIDLPLDPGANAVRLIPNGPHDFSAASFDASLRELHAGLVDRFGL